MIMRLATLKAGQGAFHKIVVFAVERNIKERVDIVKKTVHKKAQT